MSEDDKANPEAQARPERRRFTAEYKRSIVAEAEQCEYGELIIYCNTINSTFLFGKGHRNEFLIGAYKCF